MTRLELTADAAGERADQFLSRSVENLTRSGAQKLLEDGAVLCNGEPVKKNRRTTPGEVYTVDLPDPEPIEAVAQDIPLDVVYEDEDVIVVNKPVGLVVHPAPGHPDPGGGYLRRAFAQRSADTGLRRPAPRAGRRAFPYPRACRAAGAQYQGNGDLTP